MKKSLTCTVCPMGCSLTAEIEGERVTAVWGNTCPRGRAYAESECICPMRTLTTTVRTEDGAVVSVKTAAPIPRDTIKDAMQMINSIVCPLPIRAGDVIIENISGTGVAVLATADKGGTAT